MHRLQRFFDILWKSVSDRQYYHDILRASFGFSAKYLLILLFILSLATIMRNAVWFIPKFPSVQTGLENIKSTIKTLYPEELVVTISDGVLSTNADEPNRIDIPVSWREALGEDDYKYLFVIDTKASAQDFDSYNTIFLVTDKSVIYPDQRGYKVSSLTDLSGDTVIDQKKYEAAVSEITPLLNALQSLVAVFLVAYAIFGPFVGSIIAFTGKLIYLLLFTLAVLLIAKILNLPYGYKDLYRLSMHGLTTPILVTYVFSVLGL